MRTSPAMLYKNYLKKTKEESEEEEPPKTAPQTITSKTITKLTPEEKQKYKQDRRDYYKQYYETKKNVLLEWAKENDKNKYWMRIVREIRQGKKDIDDMKPETIEKYKIEWDRKKNEYISLIDPDY